jgi:hypothetical protein
MVNWRLTPAELASLSYKDFSVMVSAWFGVESRRAENARVNAAHTAWLLGADAGIGFGKFCEKYGITGKRLKEVEKPDTKRLYEMADKITERILQGKGKTK